MADYYSHIHQLYSELSLIKKDHFDPDDRIIFEFSDTEYYFEDRYGLGLINLYRIIDYLNIPTFFCIIITQQDFVKKNIQQLNQKYFLHDDPIKVVETYVDAANILSAIPKVTSNFTKIKKSYTFLSGQHRKHRSMFFSLLNANSLLNHANVSFRLADSVNRIENPLKYAPYSTIEFLPTDLELIVTIPFSLCNENWRSSDNNLLSIYNIFLKNTPGDFIFKNFKESVHSTADLMPANLDVIQQSFLYIANESMFNYPGCYITEKSFKGIICKRPFVMLGPTNNLKKLKEYGFKTFDQWWDEGYDKIIDPATRLMAIFNIVENICQKTAEELKNISIEMEEVLQYNYHHLTTNFVDSQWDNFIKQCNTNSGRTI